MMKTCVIACFLTILLFAAVMHIGKLIEFPDFLSR